MDYPKFVVSNQKENSLVYKELMITLVSCDDTFEYSQIKQRSIQRIVYYQMIPIWANMPYTQKHTDRRAYHTHICVYPYKDSHIRWLPLQLELKNILHKRINVIACSPSKTNAGESSQFP